MKDEEEIRRQLWNEFRDIGIDDELYPAWLEDKFIEFYQAVEKVMEKIQ